MIDFTNMEVYNPELGLNGKISDLIDWSYRYDKDYSDEALKEISRLAKEFHFDEKDQQIPILVMKDRNRRKMGKKTLPYEQLKLDKLRGGKIGLDEQTEYGEVEIMEDRGYVCFSITGEDDGGFFRASNMVSTQDFLDGEDDFLEGIIGETLYYDKQYEVA